MADDIEIEIDFDLMYVDRHATIILEAYRLKQRIDLLGLRVSGISYRTGESMKTLPRINCRNKRQDFIILKPRPPDSRADRRALVMLFLALGKICEIHASNVDVFYGDRGQKPSISSKHKRGTLQRKFEKSLNNETLLSQIGARFKELHYDNLTDIENDLLKLTVNNRISEDVAVQYCQSTGISHEDLHNAFIGLQFGKSISQEEMPRGLELPPVPFAEHMEKIEDLFEDLDSEHDKRQKFRMHVFICANKRSPESSRGCCAAKNSLAILTRLKRAARAEGLEDVRVNKAGCLDNCESGPSCVVYPEGIWYTLPDDDDGLKAVLEHLKGGEPASDYLIGD